MCEFALTDQQKALQGLAREFATKEVRPVAKLLDSELDLGRRFPWEVFERASQLGLRTLALPASEGGAGMDVLTHCLVFEELAYGDAGFATTLDQTWRLSSLLTRNEATRSTVLPAFRADPRALLTLVAGDGNGNRPVASRRAGGLRVISGESASVIAGGIARIFVVEAAEADGQASLFAVGADRPGLQVTRLVAKTGRRLEPTADIGLADCAVTQADLVGSEGQGSAIVKQLADRYAAVTAIGAIGVARAANDLALDWARRRVQGGKVIARHQAVAAKLGDMYVNLAAGRALAFQAARAVDQGLETAAELGLAAGVFCTQTANRTCYMAMEVCGGIGFMREGGLEKFVRDAVGYLTDEPVDDWRVRLGTIAAGDLVER